MRKGERTRRTDRSLGARHRRLATAPGDVLAMIVQHHAAEHCDRRVPAAAGRLSAEAGRSGGATVLCLAWRLSITRGPHRTGFLERCRRRWRARRRGVPSGQQTRRLVSCGRRPGMSGAIIWRGFACAALDAAQDGAARSAGGCRARQRRAAASAVRVRATAWTSSAPIPRHRRRSGRSTAPACSTPAGRCSPASRRGRSRSAGMWRCRAPSWRRWAAAALSSSAAGRRTGTRRRGRPRRLRLVRHRALPSLPRCGGGRATTPLAPGRGPPTEAPELSAEHPFSILEPPARPDGVLARALAGLSRR
jgi:hypothetical protein